jgi:hypothetical protein
MHYLFAVYSITIPLHVLGLLVAHHQEVTMYICNKWHMLCVLVDCQLAWLEWDLKKEDIYATSMKNFVFLVQVAFLSLMWAGFSLFPLHGS